MSDDHSQPDMTIERLVTDMLARRAADIPADPDEAARIPPTGRSTVSERHTTQPWRRRDRRRWLAGAAGLLIVAGVFAQGQRDGQDGGANPTARIDAGVVDRQDHATDDTQEATTGSPPAGDGTNDPAVSDVAATLPDGFDLRSASMIELGREPTTDPVQVAEDYVADRLPDLPVAIRPAGDDGTLHLFRWSVEGDGFPDLDAPGGWVIVRVDPERAGVVAAITDGVDLTGLARNGGRLTITATHDHESDLFADVTDLHAQPVVGGVDGPPFGTAGSTDGSDRLDLTVDVPPWPAAVRLQHVAGTFLSITEAVVDPSGFAASCGLTPPVEIEVGGRLGPLGPGPVDDMPRPSVANQEVWHHAGTEASKHTATEIRWPPDPALVGRIGYHAIGRDLIATIATGTPLGSSTSPVPLTGQNHTLIAVGDNGATNPCDLVQLSVLGDPETAAWWAGALAGEWSLDLPLTVATADLDPLVGPDGTGGESPAAGSQELIAEAREGVDAADVPQVPPTGSCDGLPDDPPRTGAVSGAILPTAEQALADFVATMASAEPLPLATTGYVEYRPTGDGTRSYVIESGGRAVTVVQVEQADGGWRVANWEAAVC